MAKNGFIMRIAPGKEDKVAEALDSDHLIIGWARAKGLLDPNLEWEEFREIIHEEYYNEEHNRQRAGFATERLWCFIRVMEVGDLVVVPHGSEFYVGEVQGDAFYDTAKVAEDSAYRRPVKWLNDKRAIPRATAAPALVARMKRQGTIVKATDLVNEIEDCLTGGGPGEATAKY